MNSANPPRDPDWTDVARLLQTASDDLTHVAMCCRSLKARELGACFEGMAACMDKIVREIELGQRYL